MSLGLVVSDVRGANALMRYSNSRDQIYLKIRRLSFPNSSLKHASLILAFPQ